MPAIKVKNDHLMRSLGFLSKINTEERSIKFCFHVNTVINRVNEVIKVIEETRKKILDANTVKDENGKPVFVDENKRYIKLTDEGSKKMAELFELESDIEFEQFTLDGLEAVGVKIAPADVDHLRWLVKV